MLVSTVVSLAPELSTEVSPAPEFNTPVKPAPSSLTFSWGLKSGTGVCCALVKPLEPPVGTAPDTGSETGINASVFFLPFFVTMTITIIMMTMTTATPPMAKGQMFFFSFMLSRVLFSSFTALSTSD